MWLELARGHGVLVVLRLRLDVWVHGSVPGRMHLRIRRRVRRRIVLRMGVWSIWIVVDGRVCLRGHVIVLVLPLAPSRMERHSRRYVRAWHHGRQAESVAFTVGRRPETKQPTSEATEDWARRAL